MKIDTNGTIVSIRQRETAAFDIQRTLIILKDTLACLSSDSLYLIKGRWTDERVKNAKDT
jgi:hypothetical protein